MEIHRVTSSQFTLFGGIFLFPPLYEIASYLRKKLDRLSDVMLTADCNKMNAVRVGLLVTFQNNIAV